METRRRYVRHFLDDYGAYVANIDFGAKNGREHYHAILQCSSVDCSLWRYGNLDFKRVLTPNSQAISKYISKLTNHALKETTKGFNIIYSRWRCTPLAVVKDLEKSFLTTAFFLLLFQKTFFPWRPIEAYNFSIWAEHSIASLSCLPYMRMPFLQGGSGACYMHPGPLAMLDAVVILFQVFLRFFSWPFCPCLL